MRSRGGLGQGNTLRWLAAILASLALHYLALTQAFPTHGLKPPTGATHISLRSIAIPSADPPPGARSEFVPTQQDAAPAAAPSRSPTHKVEAGLAERDARTTQAIRFYSIDEVDQPAQPTDDWQLPLEELQAFKIQSLVFRVWISKEGEVLEVSLISSRPQITQNHQVRLAQSLMRTKMRAATRSEEAVASQRTIEMAFEF